MPTAIAITGTVADGSGVGVPDVVVRLSPEAASTEGGEQAQQGIGIVRRPVEVLTDENGDFTVTALAGFRYRLTIEAIGYDRVFVAPGTDTAFHLLGLSPSVDSAANGVDADGATKVYVLVKVGSEAVVRERFDTLVLERADGQDGPWTEVLTWDLRPEKTFYSYADTPADESVFYRAVYEDSATGDRSAYGDVVAAEDADDSELVISVKELKEHYLFGVDLTDDYGRPMPDSLFQHYIRAAVRQVEKELDIPIVPIEVENETFDHYAHEYGRWGWFTLHHYPIIEIREIAFQYPSMTQKVVINPQWIVLQDGGMSGQVQIVPGQGNIADVLLIPGQLMPLWSGASGRVPGVWRATYRAGFELKQVPDDLKHLIAMMAAIGPFNIAGDLIAGAGIATKSVSVPGLSQNIGTTASATNAGFGARILEYQKEIKAILPVLKSFYGKTMKMTVA